MSVIHISEKEASRNLNALVSLAVHGEHIIIDAANASVRLVADSQIQGRTGYEMLAILENLPGERGVMEEEFARDVLHFRERHPEGLDGSKWD